MLDGATRSRSKSASATGDTAPRIPICIHRPFGGRRGQLAFGVLCSNLRGAACQRCNERTAAREARGHRVPADVGRHGEHRAM